MNNQNNKVVCGLGGIIVGVLLVSLFTPMMRYGGFGMMNWGNDSKNQRMGMNIQSGTIDKHFIEQMIPHHEGAVAMANLALQKSKRQEIKILATAIIDAQTSEIEDMRVWYKNWFGDSVPKISVGMMSGGMMSRSGMHMGGQEDMTALQNAADFDKEFIEQMIPHHQMAIMMAQMLESGTNRPEMKQLAKNIQTSQAEEIKQMQSWYASWYK